MGKKIVAVVMLVAQIITGNISSELANGVNHNYIDDTMLKEISFAEVKDEDTEVLYVNEKNIDTFMDTDKAHKGIIDDFLNRNGALVVYGSSPSVHENVEDVLDVKVKEVQPATSGGDVKVATIYYKKGNVLATYEINVDKTDDIDTDKCIEEALSTIESESQTPQVAAATTAMELIAYKTYTYIREPKGELRVIYKVYTLQNVEGLDFYVVQAEVTGLPGADLGGDYETQYEGEKMSVNISTPTSGMSHKKSGPNDTTNKTQVTVNIEGAFNTIEKDVTISGGLSWTFDTENVKIDKTIDAPTVNWDLVLSGNAQKHEYNFEPAVVYTCPQAKSSVKFDTYASYTLDSLWTAQEKIALDKSFTCTP